MKFIDTFKPKWSKPTIPLLNYIIFKLKSHYKFNIDLDLLNCVKIKNCSKTVKFTLY